MSMRENITRGRESKPPRLVIYGQEGVGKSTVGAAAPNPRFVQTEDGLGEIDTAKFPLAKNLNDVLAALTALREEPHDFQTVVLDSADWLERLIWDQVCAEFGVRSIEKADGGYGKGYVHALGHWRKVVALAGRGTPAPRRAGGLSSSSRTARSSGSRTRRTPPTTATRPGCTSRRPASSASGRTPSSSRPSASA